MSDFCAVCNAGAIPPVPEQLLGLCREHRAEAESLVRRLRDALRTKTRPSVYDDIRALLAEADAYLLHEETNEQRQLWLKQESAEILGETEGK